MISDDDELVCYCSDSCEDINNSTCVIDKNGYCFTSVKHVFNEVDKIYEEEITYGCFPPEETGLMQCKGHHVNHHIKTSTLCCNDQDFCNFNLKPNYTATTIEINDINDHYSPYSYIFWCLLTFLIFCLLFYLFKKCAKPLLKCSKKLNKHLTLDHRHSRKSFEYSSSSGSGSGDGILRCRTLADQIDFIGKIGSFGRVYRVIWRGQQYSCRVYNSFEQTLWNNEINIQTKLVSPEVVGLIAADMGDSISSQRFLLLTDFFENGSLFHFLKVKTFDSPTMLSLMLSIARGMNYLHSEILGNSGKPSIVHCNIKSRNIMVASCGSRCLISDFSSACAYANGLKICGPPTFPSYNVESLRYRAPETFGSSDFLEEEKCGKACDIYSLALVFWEIASRCELPGSGDTYVVPAHQLPYENELDNKIPGHLNIYELVCLKKMRPKFQDEWSESPVLSKISNLIMDSWHHHPPSRLTILRIRKNLESMM